MSIRFDFANRVFTLTTKDTMYQMQIGPVGHLLHLYYGGKTDDCFDYLQLDWDCGFSPNPYDWQQGRGWSLDTKAQEYSSEHTGDYRVSSLSLETVSGVSGTDLRYVNHRILGEKYQISGMPSAFDRTGKAQSLSVTLADAATGVQVELLYGVFEEENVITRAVRVQNTGSGTVKLEKAASACLDLPFGDWQLLHFHGRHTMERAMERRSLMNGIQTVSSTRGASSHQHNPFVILCQPETTEDFGECYGMMLVYSGNHRTDVELDQSGAVRAVMGIHDEGFRWTLNPGETFETPEVLLVYTGEGLTKLSQTYHKFIQHNICRSRYALERRPVLLNSWEAAYMDISEEKLLSIAKGAKELGVELFVIDDGWFGNRDDDFRSLGDWFPHKRKFPEGLTATVQKIRDLGLKVGLWVEPEMISEDSDLYRAHPDWALTVPGRKPAMGRCQLVLDMSRSDVVDWLYGILSGLLRDNPIDYIKWDMNRNLADVYSRALPASRQGEVSHRFVLGYYGLMERLTKEFPDVLFEGCAGGGGRFDAGALAYSPQIWCSDNTDPIARLSIQRGTSFGYPVACMGAHVSASPNHQTGRSTPIGTRATVAMAGTFGYELDPAKLTEDEKKTVRTQITRYHELQDLIREGDYYRLAGDAWELVSEDQEEALLSFVLVNPTSNPKPNHIRLKGLDPDARYQVAWADFHESKAKLPHDAGRSFTGMALMRGGYTLPILFGDYPSVQILFKKLSWEGYPVTEKLQKARDYEALRRPEVAPQLPAFHLTGGVGWINDPNGFAPYRGEYHLFFQYYPYDTQWGPMHWGHAKTKDFVRWEFLPAALAPDAQYDQDGCFSGGALELPDGRQLLLYTGVEIRPEGEFQTQCAAIGDGVNYEKYPGNPVITADSLPEGNSTRDFRDPKIWRENGMYYAVTVNRGKDGSGDVLLYESPDGLHWHFSSILFACRCRYGTMWECPDYFHLEGKDVLIHSVMEMRAKTLEYHNGNCKMYHIGHTDDEKHFHAEVSHAMENGLDFYAPQTLEALDGRRILIGWMQAWEGSKQRIPGMDFMGQMTVPRELTIRAGRLLQWPVRELESYRRNLVAYKSITIQKETALPGVSGRVLDMVLEITPGETPYTRFDLEIAKGGGFFTAITLFPQKGTIRLDRTFSAHPHDVNHIREFPADFRDGSIRLRLLLDRYSAELFVGNGEQAASMVLYTPQSDDGITLRSDRPVQVSVEKYDLDIQDNWRAAK